MMLHLRRTKDVILSFSIRREFVSNCYLTMFDEDEATSNSWNVHWLVFLKVNRDFVKYLKFFAFYSFTISSLVLVEVQGTTGFMATKGQNVIGYVFCSLVLYFANFFISCFLEIFDHFWKFSVDLMSFFVCWYSLLFVIRFWDYCIVTKPLLFIMFHLLFTFFLC